MVEEKVYVYRKASNAANTILLFLLPCLADVVFISPFFVRTPLNEEIWKFGDNFPFAIIPMVVSIAFWVMGYGLLLIERNEQIVLFPSGIMWIDWKGRATLTLTNEELKDIQLIPADNADRSELSIDNRGRMDIVMKTDVCIIVGTTGDIRFSSLIRDYEDLVREVKRRLPATHS